MSNDQALIGGFMRAGNGSLDLPCCEHAGIGCLAVGVPSR